MLDLAVIESRWWPAGNSSVRGIFEIVADILENNPHAYHYEMFNNAASIREIVPRIAQKSYIKNLYIGAHGDYSDIYGAEAAEDNKISRTILRNTLREVPRKSLKGLYFGTCLTGGEDTVDFLMKEIGVRWIAGYSREIDWLESMTLDLYFWTTYYGIGRSGSEGDHIRRVAKKMKMVKGLYRKLGFDIFVRKKRRGGRVKKLLNGD